MHRTFTAYCCQSGEDKSTGRQWNCCLTQSTIVQITSKRAMCIVTSTETEVCWVAGVMKNPAISQGGTKPHFITKILSYSLFNIFNNFLLLQVRCPEQQSHPQTNRQREEFIHLTTFSLCRTHSALQARKSSYLQRQWAQLSRANSF